MSMPAAAQRTRMRRSVAMARRLSTGRLKMAGEYCGRSISLVDAIGDTTPTARARLSVIPRSRDTVASSGAHIQR